MRVTKGEYEELMTVVASAGDCELCRKSCAVTNNFIVSELSVSCPAWIGLDRTDDRPDHIGISATATLDPELEDAECQWEYSGVCKSVVEPTNPYQCNLTATNRNVASEGYLSEVVKATVLGCTAVTNFTVMKVDVAIDGVTEEEEDILYYSIVPTVWRCMRVYGGVCLLGFLAVYGMTMFDRVRCCYTVCYTADVSLSD